MLFGLECPGCGFQRSILALLEGNFNEAFKVYPPIYTILLLLLYIAVSQKVKIKGSKKVLYSLLYLNGFTILISYILKMSYLFSF